MEKRENIGNVNKLYEINNSDVERLLSEKISEIYVANKEKYVSNEIDLVDISFANVNGKIVYQITERDRDGNENKSYYDGNAEFIASDDSKFMKPIFSDKGFGKSLGEDPENFEKFLDNYNANEELSISEINENKVDKARIDAISKSLGVDSNDINIDEFDLKKIDEAGMKLDDINQSNIMQTVDGNQRITHFDSYNSFLGGDYQKILFVKVGNNRVIAYGLNDKGNLTPIPLKQTVDGPYKTNVIDRDGVIRKNVTQSGIYLSNSSNGEKDEGLSININQNGKFEISYNRNMNSDNPIGAVITDSKIYNNQKMLEYVDKYNTSKEEIEEDNKVVNMNKEKNDYNMNIDMISSDSDSYLKNDVLGEDLSREVYYECKCNIDEFNKVLRFVKENDIKCDDINAEDLVKEAEDNNFEKNGIDHEIEPIDHYEELMKRGEIWANNG